MREAIVGFLGSERKRVEKVQVGTGKNVAARIETDYFFVFFF